MVRSVSEGAAWALVWVITLVWVGVFAWRMGLVRVEIRDVRAEDQDDDDFDITPDDDDFIPCVVPQALPIG